MMVKKRRMLACLGVSSNHREDPHEIQPNACRVVRGIRTPVFPPDTVRMIFLAYQDAYDETQSLSREVAHDFRGHVRRAKIEERWPAVAQRYAKEGVRCSYQLNHKRTSYFTRITFGRVILTQSYVNTPKSIIRRAEFRRTLARPNYRGFFELDPPPLPDDPLFALLIHGEDWKRRLPYFADIVFPDRHCQKYLGASRSSRSAGRPSRNF